MIERFESPIDRRRALIALGGFGIAALAACTSRRSSSAATTTAATTTTTTSGSTSTTAAAAASCDVIPEETGGPYPGDGSNGPNILTQDGVVRSDITKSIGSASGTATGVPLTIDLTVLDAGNDCAPLAGAAIYLWHCDSAGEYSMYGRAIANENYLRGVQETDRTGLASFTSIFPAAYSGRWPHIHFEVYESVDDATSGGTPITTSQLALPEAVCELVYATDGYSQSVRNLAGTSLATDNVFSDGSDQQLATVTGNVTSGFTAALTFTVDADATAARSRA